MGALYWSLSIVLSARSYTPIFSFSKVVAGTDRCLFRRLGVLWFEHFKTNSQSKLNQFTQFGVGDVHYVDLAIFNRNQKIFKLEHRKTPLTDQVI